MTESARSARPARRAPAPSTLSAVLLCALLCVQLTTPGTTRAQWGDGAEGILQAANLLEYQVGRDPTLEENEVTRLVDQFILDYTRDDLRLGLR